MITFKEAPVRSRHRPSGRRISLERADPATARLSPAAEGLGNQAAQRFAEACPLRLPGPRRCPFGGACHACPVRPQAKLRVNEPGDRYEREADRVAEQVMRMPEPGRRARSAVIEPPDVQRSCADCDEEVQRQAEPEEEEPEEGLSEMGEAVQTKPAAGTRPAMTPEVESRIRSLGAGGRPLSRSERAFFEPRFGADFSGVRVHSDHRASAASAAVGARAFTLGRSVFFAAGEHRPGTGDGRRLMAHELTHFLQQASGGPARRSELQTKRSAAGLLQRKAGQIVIAAGGYPEYESAKDEVKTLESGLWKPNSPDFLATADDTQKTNKWSASNNGEFFGALMAFKGKIKRVVFIGHGNASSLGLSGDRRGFTDNALGSMGLSRWQDTINLKIRKKLLENATIDLYSCNELGGNIAKALARSFGVCTRYFKGPLAWCLGYDESGRITSRGRIAEKKPKTAGPGNCMGKPWVRGANRLIPPQKVCK